MTSVDPTLSQPAPDPASMRAQMKFIGGPPRMGIEIEFHVQDLEAGSDPAPAIDERMRALKHNLRIRHGILVDDEPAAHMVEVKTDAYELRDIKTLLRELARLQRAVMEETALLRLKPAPFGVMAGLSAKRALTNLIDPTRDDPHRGMRVRTMMEGLKNTGMTHLIPYPLLNVSAQASVSARNPDHLFAMIRRHYTLLPFLFTVLHNRPPVFDRLGRKLTVHSGIAARQLMGERGLIAPVFARSVDGEEYIRRYLESVFDRPMMAHIGLTQEFTAASAMPGVTLRQLRDHGLATRGNALLSQSMDWYAAKMKTIPGTDFMRAEMRDMDTGGHHAVSLAVINGLMNMDDECGAAIDRLLARYGYGGPPPAYAAALQRNLNHVAKHVRDFMNVPYGTGRMNRFARDFIKIIEKYAHKHDVLDDIGPLRHACHHAMPEARVLDAILHTPQDVARFQRIYDRDLMADPRTSLALRLRWVMP